jgi:hypothetical protein
MYTERNNIIWELRKGEFWSEWGVRIYLALFVIDAQWATSRCWGVSSVGHEGCFVPTNGLI